MNVEFQNIVLTVTPTEAVDLYYALKREIENSIKTHWIKYPTNWEDSCRVKLDMLQQLSRVVNHEDYEYTLTGFKKLFIENEQHSNLPQRSV